MRQINSVGRRQSWVPMTAHTRAVYSSSIFSSLPTTPSNLRRCSLRLGSTTPTLIITGQSVLTFWKTSGPLLWLSTRYSFRLAPCWRTRTLMTHWHLTLPRFTSPTLNSTMSMRETGPIGMLHEWTRFSITKPLSRLAAEDFRRSWKLPLSFPSYLSE